MKQKIPAYLLFLFIGISVQAQNIEFKKGNRQSSSCVNTSIDVILEIKETTSTIILPEDINLLTPTGRGITLNICAKDLRENTSNALDTLQLSIGASFINTTLEPVKIPPPPPPSGIQSNSLLKSNSCFFETQKVVPTLNIGSGGYPIPPGNYNIFLNLKKNGISQDTDRILFRVYGYSDNDYISLIKTISRDTNRDKVVIQCEYRNRMNGSMPSNQKIKLYYSQDSKLDTNDIELGTAVSQNPEGFYFETSNHVYQWLLEKNRYLISMVNPDGEHDEICLQNNTNSIQVQQPISILPKILPDLLMSNSTITLSENGQVKISYVIKNIGDINAVNTELEIHTKEQYPKLVRKIAIPELKTGGSYENSFYVTWYYYQNILKGKSLVFHVDPYNKVEELNDHSNNQKIYAVPDFSNSNPSNIKVYPNPFNYYVHFEYEVKHANTDIQLLIYDSFGNLRYETNRLHNNSGVYRITVYGRNFDPGIYQYTLLKHADENHSIHRGAILKNTTRPYPLP